MTEVFSLAGLDPEDSAAHERRWNGWVEELAYRGLEPEEQPLAWTDLTMTFRLRPVAGLGSFSTTGAFAVAG